MRSVLLIAKVIGLVLAGLIALVVIFFACVLLRKNMPYVFAGDIERLAATGPYNSREMATEACGNGVDFVGSAETSSPTEGLPKVGVLSWRFLYPMEGTASVRVTGIGFNRAADRPTGPCEATMTFRYRFLWAYNGRSLGLAASFVDWPTIVRR